MWTKEPKVCTGMMASKPRLIADPSIGVSDLKRPLEQFIIKIGDKNIVKHIQPPPGISWKGACPVSWLAGLAPLLEEYVKVAPNGVITSKKHKIALERLEEDQKVNWTRKPTSDFLDLMDDWVRMALSHLRTLKQYSDKKDQAFRRADSAHQTAFVGGSLEFDEGCT